MLMDTDTLTFIMNVLSTSATLFSTATDAAQLSKGRGGFWAKIRKHTPFLKGKRIAFLGATGVGKTVLLDYLSGKGYNKGYVPSRELSANTETEKLTYADRKTTIVVVPGQSSRERIVSLNELRQKPVDGIVYVVANGFATVRDPNVAKTISSICSDVNSYRKYKLQEELEDIKEVSKFVIDSWSQHQKPTWILVVPTKLDLYSEKVEVEKVFSYYAPGGQSEFVNAVESIRLKVGENNLIWDMSPVFTWSEEFSWNGEVVASKLDQVKRDNLLSHFESKLEKYCKQ